MKKVMQLFFVICLSLFVFTGCATTSGWQKEFANAPEWVSNPSIEGGIGAVGVAEKSRSTHKARTVATLRARAELARMINSDVANLLKDFTETAGIGDDETMNATFLDVSKSTSQAALKGSKQIRMWPSPDGDTYVLVAIEPATVKDIVKESIESNLKKDNALWQQFRSNKAHEELENEIRKTFEKYKALGK